MRTALPPLPGGFPPEDENSKKARVARLKGYESSACTNCGAYTVIRNGLSLKCDTCAAVDGVAPILSKREIHPLVMAYNMTPKDVRLKWMAEAGNQAESTKQDHCGCLVFVQREGKGAVAMGVMSLPQLFARKEAVIFCRAVPEGKGHNLEVYDPPIMVLISRLKRQGKGKE